jgi:hypothetical protein
LTVCDAFSRFILAVQTLPKATSPNVRTAFVRLFEEYGMPNVIKTIHGCPFASPFTPLGLSSLSTWWVSLGIEWDRVQHAHLQGNGGQKRLHRELQAEIAQHLQPDPVRQQAALDRWREEFNGKRPHPALGGRPPGEVYRKSNKSFHSCAGSLAYGPGHFPRKISRVGTLRWYSRMIFVSRILAGYSVGLKLRASDQLEVWFGHLHLGDIELQTSRFLREPSRPKEDARLSA